MGKARDLVEGSLDLFSLPSVYLQLRSTLANPDTSADEIAAVIQTDPGLTTRLLRLVNSAWFGYLARIDTVTRAVVVLGRGPVHDLALATSLTDRFEELDLRLLNMDSYWERSVRCASIAQLLARKCNVLEPERLFVAGLLHEIGHLVMFNRIPDEAQGALIRSLVEDRPVWEVEREDFGFDYGEVGAELMHSWLLPEPLQETARFHMQPHRSERAPLDTCIVHIACRVGLLDPGMEFEPTAATRYAMRLMGMEANTVQSIGADALEQAQHIGMALRAA